MLVVGVYAKLEKHFRQKPKEILPHSTFFPLCYCIATSNINLNNHLKKPRGIDTSLRCNNNIITVDEKRRILIVDDDPDITNLYKLSLERDGFVVDAFNDPLLALSNYKVGTYDLLLIDIKMPKMNGFELYQKLRNMDDKPKVCFITAYEEFNKEFKKIFPNFREKGCFLRKPIELQSLTRAVKSELGYN
jgi:CheY-like chemotaxis protein